MTEQEMLQTLLASQPKLGDGEGNTVAEIAAQTGVGIQKVRRLLKAGMAAGTVRRSSRVIQNLCGQTITTQTYVVLKAKRK